jgi:hypothetical protein
MLQPPSQPPLLPAGFIGSLFFLGVWLAGSLLCVVISALAYVRYHPGFPAIVLCFSGVGLVGSGNSDIIGGIMLAVGIILFAFWTRDLYEEARWVMLIISTSSSLSSSLSSS